MEKWETAGYRNRKPFFAPPYTYSSLVASVDTDGLVPTTLAVGRALTRSAPTFPNIDVRNWYDRRRDSLWYGIAFY